MAVEAVTFPWRRWKVTASPMELWKTEEVSDYLAIPVVWVAAGETCFSPAASTLISDKGPPGLREGRRKGTKQIRISKGVKGMWFLLSTSGLQQESAF